MFIVRAYICFSIVLKYFAAFANVTQGLNVCVPNLGCIRGTYMPGYQMEKYEAFLGIPYAKPPIGDLRFKSPEPIEAWQNILQATTPKAPCLQKQYFTPTKPIIGEEDCLYLNLYRPVNRGAKNLPVIFYIHGGGYFAGSANPDILGPEYFMDTEEVIFVAAAYRLGPFGFLSTGDENMPGNFGLKDQNLALKWVHDNVAAFAGDPQAITIFGHSAGACAVHLHMLSAASNGLFQRAIAMSGTALAPFTAPLNSTEAYAQATQVAKSAGISNATELTTSDLVVMLHKLDAITLLNAGDSLRYWHLIPLISFRPVIENVNWSNPFLTEYPQNLIINGNFKHMPWIMGTVPSQGEGALFEVFILECGNLVEELNANFDSNLKLIINLPEETTTNAYEMIISEYFEGKHELNIDNILSLAELVGDMTFYYPLYKSSKNYLHYADTSENPLYLLKFNYYGSHSNTALFNCNGNFNYSNVVHVDDTFYLFRTPKLFSDFTRNSVEAELVKNYVDIYVDFAKNVKPQGFDNIDLCTEGNFNANNNSGICNYLELSNNGDDSFKVEAERSFNIKRMQFWDKIYQV